METSIDGVATALHEFEVYTSYREFKAFHYQQAVAFKRHLAEQMSRRSGDQLSKATLYATLSVLRNFFFWLAGQPGYRSRLTYSDAEYFNASEKDARIAKARREPRAPTLDQVRHALDRMPMTSEIERRDRAVVALALLTGARDGAIISLKLKHVDLTEGRVIFDAREVKTKFSKSFNTWFFPVGDQVRRSSLNGSNTCCARDCLDLMIRCFPRPKLRSMRISSSRLLACRAGIGAMPRQFRSIFREAFTRAGLPYFNPHSVRNTLALLGERLCRTPEQFKAWSQNLGHEKVLTTFSAYGVVGAARQSEIIRELGENPRHRGSPDRRTGKTTNKGRETDGINFKKARQRPDGRGGFTRKATHNNHKPTESGRFREFAQFLAPIIVIIGIMATRH